MPTRKVIISCAVTGSIHALDDAAPARHPEPDRRAAIGAAEAGAAILHLHARDPETGRPTPDPGRVRAVPARDPARADAVINITTGGGHGMTLEERTRRRATFKPELCSLNMGR